MQIKKIFEMLSSSNIKYPKDLNDVDSLFFKNQNNRFVVVDKQYNQSYSLLDLIFDWNYYPFLNKEQTFKDIYTKNFFNLNNKDFFVKDKNHEEDSLFVSKLWVDCVIEFLQQDKFGPDPIYHFVWGRDKNKKKMYFDEVHLIYSTIYRLENQEYQESLLSALKSFITRSKEFIEELFLFAKSLYKVLGCFLLKGYQYKDKFMWLNDFLCDPIEIYKDVNKNALPKDIKLSTIYKQIKFFTSNRRYFSFRDLYDPNSSLYQIKDHFFDTLLNLNSNDLIELSKKERAYYFNFISFIHNFSIDFYNKIRTDLISNFKELTSIFFSSLKPLKHTSFILNEVANNYLKDSIHNIIKQDDYVIYKNALKFYNIVDAWKYNTSNLDVFNKTDTVIPSFTSLNYDDLLLNISDDYLLKDKLANNLLYFIQTSKPNIDLKNPMNINDTLNNSKYAIPFIFSYNEISSIRGEILKFLSEQTLHKDYVYLRNKDDVFFDNLVPTSSNWINTSLYYDVSDKNIKDTMLQQAQIRNERYTPKLLDKTGFYNDNNLIKENIFEPFKNDGPEQSDERLRKIYLASFFLNPNYLSYSLFFASINDDAFNSDNKVQKPKTDYSQTFDYFYNYNAPLLKIIDLKNDAHLKELKSTFKYYTDLAKLTFVFVLDKNHNFWLANFNEKQLAVINQYKPDNAYEKELKESSMQLLSKINNNEDVIDVNNENQNNIRR